MLLDLPSRQEVLDLALKLDKVLSLLERPTPKPDDLMSVEEVADYTRFHRRTVEKWAEVGDFNAQGKRVYLTAYRYTGRLRFKRSDVEAFGLGIGVLAPTLEGQPAPVKKTKKSKEPVESARALKVA